MSVRRRAIAERVSREGMRRLDYERVKRHLDAILAMCKRKIAAGEKNVSVDDLRQCFGEDA